MRAVAVGKLMGGVWCLVGLLACWLMWHEANLPPRHRPLRLFGPSGGKGLFNNPYPESCILFAGAACAMTLLGLVGLVEQRERTPTSHWGPGLIGIGVVVGVFLFQARRVNGMPMDTLQLGHCLGTTVAVGLLLSGLIICFGCVSRPDETARA